MPLRIFDTYCLINLVASGRSEDILTHARAFYIDDSVPSNLFLNAYNDETQTWTDKKQIDITSLLNSDKALLWNLRTEEEYENFLFFAELLCDREAEALALAKTRKWTVATDDRRTMNVAKEHGIRTISTLQIILDWAIRNNVSKPDLNEMALSMRQRANFVVTSKTPGYSAWSKYRK